MAQRNNLNIFPSDIYRHMVDSSMLSIESIMKLSLTDSVLNDIIHSLTLSLQQYISLWLLSNSAIRKKMQIGFSQINEFKTLVQKKDKNIWEEIFVGFLNESNAIPLKMNEFVPAIFELEPRVSIKLISELRRSSCLIASHELNEEWNILFKMFFYGKIESNDDEIKTALATIKRDAKINAALMDRIDASSQIMLAAKGNNWELVHQLANQHHVFVNFINVKMENIKFEKIRLFADCEARNITSIHAKELDCSYANFTRAQFTKCIIKNKSNFYRANCSFSTLSNSSLSDSCFADANLNEVSINKSGFTDLNFNHANLRSIKCTNSTFRKCTFIANNASYAIFEDVNFYDCMFDGADLSFSRLTNVNLCRSSFVKTKFYRAIMINAKFDEKDLIKANLKEAIFIGCSLSPEFKKAAESQQAILTWKDLVKKHRETDNKFSAAEIKLICIEFLKKISQSTKKTSPANTAIKNLINDFSSSSEYLLNTQQLISIIEIWQKRIASDGNFSAKTVAISCPHLRLFHPINSFNTVIDEMLEALLELNRYNVSNKMQLR